MNEHMDAVEALEVPEASDSLRVIQEEVWQTLYEAVDYGDITIDEAEKRYYDWIYRYSK